MNACPECGARNSPRAEWCTQCLVPLAVSEPPVDDGPVDAPGPEPATAEEPLAAPTEPAAAPSAPSAPATSASADTSHRGFRTVDGEVEWRCDGCGAWNPLFVSSCPVCGQPMTGTGDAGTWSGERVARTRRILWVVAAVVCLLALAGVVVGLVAAQGAA